MIIGVSKIKTISNASGFNYISIKNLKYATNLEDYRSATTNSSNYRYFGGAENVAEIQNLKYFGKCIKLKNVYFNYSILGGSIDELADLQVLNGRTSGSLTISGIKQSKLPDGSKVPCSIDYEDKVTINFNQSVSKGYTLVSDKI